jgi:hypothetical protein
MSDQEKQKSSDFFFDFPAFVNYGQHSKDIMAQYREITHESWSPFLGRRFVDLFLFCMAYAYSRGIEPENPKGAGNGIPKSVFTDEKMFDYMKFVAISSTNSLETGADAKKTVRICEGYAFAGFKKLYQRLQTLNSEKLKPDKKIKILIDESQNETKE